MCIRDRRGGVADECDEVVDVGQCDSQAFEYVATVAGLAQVEHRAARDDFTAVLQEHLHQVLQVTQLGLAVDQRHHVDAEGVLQLGLFVEVVQHHFGHLSLIHI